MLKTKPRKRARPTGSEDERRRAVQEAAYFRWLDRGGEHGRDFEDWLDAEEEMAQNVFDHDPEV